MDRNCIEIYRHDINFVGVTVLRRSQGRESTEYLKCERKYLENIRTCKVAALLLGGNCQTLPHLQPLSMVIEID